MAHYDKETKKFMDDVSKKEELSLKGQVARSASSIAKQVARGRPISEAIARQAIAIPTFAALEKSGSMKIVAIFKLLNSHYEHDWWNWEPETIWQTLQTDHQLEASEAIKNIVQALQMIVNTDQAFEHWHIFEKVAHAFNENPVSFGTMQPLELDEVALTIKILEHIRPKAEYQDEVCAYIAACAKNSGVVYLPKEYFPGCSQECLDDMHNNIELRDQVKRDLLKPFEENESALSIQLQRMRAIRAYVQENL